MTNRGVVFLPARLRRRRFTGRFGGDVTEPKRSIHRDRLTGLMLQMVTDGKDSSV